MKKVLFVCTKNACRSVMAEALANHYFGSQVQAFSAGTRPGKVHPFTKKVLEEFGIETASLRSKPLEEFMKEEFDLVITLCETAEKECPAFPRALKKFHLPFPDPALVKGSEEEQLCVFRQVRDEILERLKVLFRASCPLLSF